MGIHVNDDMQHSILQRNLFGNPQHAYPRQNTLPIGTTPPLCLSRHGRFSSASG